MRFKPNGSSRHSAIANFVLTLSGGQRGGRDARIGPGGDCAPDGRLIWEQRAFRDAS
jgi:hypothetical protein